MTRKAVSGATRPEVVAIYCPLWHTYDHASSWKGEGWCEWELLKAATPRFPGHYQPYQPTWGCFDESDPLSSAREISLAADHGVDVFLVDWYWYSGVKIMEEALERGLLESSNRNSVQFALMWANHSWADYFPAPFGQKWNSWLPSRHSPRDWAGVMDYCVAHYFCQPNYWKVDDHLFFSLFEPLRLVRELGGAKAFQKTLSATQRLLAKKRLLPLHLNAMVWDEHDVDELKEAGYSSTTTYNITASGKLSDNLTESYEDLIEAHGHYWAKMAETSLPHSPVVTMGWDVTPRCEQNVKWPFPSSPLTGKRDYPYGHVVEGNTPALFEKLCDLGLQHCMGTKPKPYAVFVNSWNEWTEGSFLLPEKRYGMRYLEAIRKTFGVEPSKMACTTKDIPTAPLG
ncbi:MAG: glycoside hydrolase family 99-like domain-containing protein [Candidatus Latescibacterota bacterium]